MSGTAAKARDRREIFTRYPATSVLLYNGVTIAHFLLGAAGLVVGYGSPVGWVLGPVYFSLALLEMYVVMPLKVCNKCVYYRLENSLCVSGLNVVSRRLTGPGNMRDFPGRARGAFCPNNLYLAALGFPIVAMIPALIMNFSFVLLGIMLAVAGLLVFRFFFIFTKVACVHCRAKNVCPNATAMGLNNPESN